MLLENNSIKVKELFTSYDKLNNTDKIILAINILEDKYFKVDYDTSEIIKLLKDVLIKLNPTYKTTIINFSKYKISMI